LVIPRIDIAPKGGKERIERDATPIEARRLAYLQCPRCGGVIEEKHKFEMNARGAYVAPGQQIDPDGPVIGDPPESTTVSFWVSGLASPFVAPVAMPAITQGHTLPTINNGGGRWHIEKKYRFDFDRGLSAEEPAVAWAFEKMVTAGRPPLRHAQPADRRRRE
jgi:hypothetical protein